MKCGNHWRNRLLFADTGLVGLGESKDLVLFLQILGGMKVYSTCVNGSHLDYSYTFLRSALSRRPHYCDLRTSPSKSHGFFLVTRGKQHDLSGGLSGRRGTYYTDSEQETVYHYLLSNHLTQTRLPSISAGTTSTAPHPHSYYPSVWEP